MGRTPLKCLRFQFLKEQQAQRDLQDLRVAQVLPDLRGRLDRLVQQDLRDLKGISEVLLSNMILAPLQQIQTLARGN